LDAGGEEDRVEGEEDFAEGEEADLSDVTEDV
jgi:hypothetical protein